MLPVANYPGFHVPTPTPTQTLRPGWRIPFVMVDWPKTIRTEHRGEIVGRLDPVTLDVITGRVAAVLGIGEPRTAAQR